MTKMADNHIQKAAYVFIDPRHPKTYHLRRDCSQIENYITVQRNTNRKEGRSGCRVCEARVRSEG